MEPIITAISKSAPDDISMDYQRLRAEGIQHLENLATYIWTDFNVHDPGMTILEVLCYAITDLGYRANLPIEDLLTNKNGKLMDSFYSASEVLPICPVTQNDFRKVLIDFPGIRNAWVEKAYPDDPVFYLKKDKIDREYVDSETKFIKWLKREIKELGEEIFKDIDDRMQNIYPNEEGEELTFEKVNCIEKIVEGLDITLENRKCLDDLIKICRQWLEHKASTKTYYKSKFRVASREDIHTLIKGIVDQHINQKHKDRYQAELQKQKKVFLGDKSPKDYTIESLLESIDEAFKTKVGDSKEELLKSIHITIQIVNKIICKYRYFEMCFESTKGKRKNKNGCGEGFGPDDQIYLNGLYRICIDAYADLDPNGKGAKELIDKVLKGYVDKETCVEYKGLYSYRNLCEDYQTIQIVPAQKICLCLDITIHPEADENEVMAEVMFQLQEFLTPSVPFQTLQQLLEQDFSCDEIFNGPLLNNGFIDENKLESATIPENIKLSDLYHIILEVGHVESVNGLKIKKEDDDQFVEDWCFEYRGDSDDSFCPAKPVIDLCCSVMCVQKGGISHTVKEQDIVDFIELHRLTSRNLPGDVSNLPSVPSGVFRPDLEEHISIQYEFPHNYTVGDHEVPSEASLLRKAQAKQLQAFLLFFDRTLGDYLKQLGQVNNLLSVNQDVDAPTYFYQALYEIPGIKELIGDKVFEITTDGIEKLQNTSFPSQDLEKLEEVSGSVYNGVNAFDQAMKELLGSQWSIYQTLLKNIFGRKIQSEQEWEEYQSLEDNYYVQELKQIVENDSKHFQRKHQLLDHLLARFGEAFTEHSIQVFENKKSHLRAKVDFMNSIPTLGLERPKAYNYRAKDALEGDVDVWNTTNVAGLKKRVYGLLGWGEASTKSVFSNPNYRLDEVEDRKKDRPYRYFVLNKLDDDYRPDGPPLLRSVKSYSSRRIKQIKQRLYVLINNIENYFVALSTEQSDQYKIIYEAEVYLKDNKKETIRLESVPMTENEADHFLDEIKRLINVELSGGFHLIENILLRPNDNGDELLNMSYTCDLNSRPVEPYSFWLTVVAPIWKDSMQDSEYRHYFEQLMRRETPAHIAICFKWIKHEDTMERLEDALEQWREALAKCTPDECEITSKSNVLIKILNSIPCHCYCFSSNSKPSKCDSLEIKNTVQ